MECSNTFLKQITRMNIRIYSYKKLYEYDRNEYLYKTKTTFEYIRISEYSSHPVTDWLTDWAGLVLEMLKGGHCACCGWVGSSKRSLGALFIQNISEELTWPKFFDPKAIDLASLLITFTFYERTTFSQIYYKVMTNQMFLLVSVTHMRLQDSSSKFKINLPWTVSIQWIFVNRCLQKSCFSKIIIFYA